MDKSLARKLVQNRARTPSPQPEPQPDPLPFEVQPLESWPKPKSKRKVPEIPDLKPTPVELKKVYGSTQTFSVTLEDRKAIRRFARERGINLSEWLRRVVQEAMRKELGYEED
jgi:hypothetical protein